MNRNYLLGIDIGTSGTKVVLTSLSGTKLAQYSQVNTILQPLPGFVEQDPEEAWWGGAVKGIKYCLARTGVKGHEIAGICASGMVPNLCPLDREGRLVRPAVLYRDNRAVGQVERLHKQFGWNFTLQDVAPKLLWLKENEPEHYKRIHTVLNAHSYVAYRLTGQRSSDYDIAAIFGEVFDAEQKKWLPERMEAMGLNPEVLPPLYDPLDVIGSVTVAAAREAGLAEGIPVLAGTGDSYTVLIGSGVIHKDQGLIYLGTAATFLGLRSSLQDLLGQMPFVTGKAMFLGNVLTGGEIARWFKDIVCDGSAGSFREVEDLAARAGVGANGLYALPHFLGVRTPRHNPLAKGVLFGLTTAHTAGHIYRALLESVAYALKESYEAHPYPLNRVVISGGGAKSGLWKQIIANVLGMKLEYAPQGDNALGTAFMAGIGLGLLPGFHVMEEIWLKDKEYIQPEPEMAEAYKANYSFYRELNRTVAPLYGKLAEMDSLERDCL